MDFSIPLQFLQLILAAANILVLGYAFIKFLKKPKTALDERVSKLEREILGIKESLANGNDRFKAQSETNEVMQTCMLALIDFELSFCTHQSYKHTEDLIKAKDALRKHLAKR